MAGDRFFVGRRDQGSSLFDKEERVFFQVRSLGPFGWIRLIAICAIGGTLFAVPFVALSFGRLLVWLGEVFDEIARRLFSLCAGICPHRSVNIYASERYLQAKCSLCDRSLPGSERCDVCHEFNPQSTVVNRDTDDKIIRVCRSCRALGLDERRYLLHKDDLGRHCAHAVVRGTRGIFIDRRLALNATLLARNAGFADVCVECGAVMGNESVCCRCCEKELSRKEVEALRGIPAGGERSIYCRRCKEDECSAADHRTFGYL